MNPAYNWTDTPGSGYWDYRSSLVHEVGHFLGLGHSGVGRHAADGLVAGSAVMWPYTYGRGSSLGRTLTADDITGAAVLYPSLTAETGRIHGVIHRTSGEPARYAHVIAYEPLLDRTVGGWANGEGNYEIAGLPNGRYVLRVNPIPSNHSDGAYLLPIWQGRPRLQRHCSTSSRRGIGTEGPPRSISRSVSEPAAAGPCRAAGCGNGGPGRRRGPIRDSRRTASRPGGWGAAEPTGRMVHGPPPERQGRLCETASCRPGLEAAARARCLRNPVTGHTRKRRL